MKALNKLIVGKWRGQPGICLWEVASTAVGDQLDLEGEAGRVKGDSEVSNLSI